MAAGKLEQAASRLGHAIKVETQGALGLENELTQADIDAADVAILAAGVAIEKPERFGRIRKVQVPVESVLTDALAVLKQAQDG
jgi:PTS system fructose-specific IIB component/fructose-specific PTS system IIB-like component